MALYYLEDVVRSAIVEPDGLLRSLDAIHLATARLLGQELTALLTYDDRLAQAATDAGIPVLAPTMRKHPHPPPTASGLTGGDLDAYRIGNSGSVWSRRLGRSGLRL